MLSERLQPPSQQSYPTKPQDALVQLSPGPVTLVKPSSLQDNGAQLEISPEEGLDLRHNSDVVMQRPMYSPPADSEPGPDQSSIRPPLVSQVSPTAY